MFKNILEGLENSENKYREKIIFGELDGNITYHNFLINAKKIGSSIAQKIHSRKAPAVIFIDQCY